jgi:hypothetical protein
LKVFSSIYYTATERINELETRSKKLSKIHPEDKRKR